MNLTKFEINFFSRFLCHALSRRARPLKSQTFVLIVQEANEWNELRATINPAFVAVH